MKKLFAALIVLSLLLTLSAGFTASAEEGFDPNLVGAWVLDRTEGGEDVSSELLENLFEDLFFLHDGRFSCAVLPFAYVAAMEMDAPRAMTADSTIFLQESLAEVLNNAVYSLFSILPESCREYADELGSISELRIAYEFFDIPEKGNDDVFPHDDMEMTLFKESDKDGLKLHVTAIVAEDGLSRKAVDATFRLHKTVSEDLMRAYLTGDWSDSINNSWRFGYIVKDKVPVYQYAATLANGEYHESDPGYGPWARYAGDSVYGSLEPYFDGASTVYKILDLTENTLTMRDSVGEIIMTRTW